MNRPQLFSSIVLAAAAAFAAGCRDKEPEGPPPSGPQSDFKMGFRTLEGKLAAPPEDVARAAKEILERMGLTGVTRHTSPTWFAVVDGRKPGMPPTTYQIQVRGADNYESFVQISVGMSGDEDASRNLVAEIAKSLNLSGEPPAQ